MSSPSWNTIPLWRCLACVVAVVATAGCADSIGPSPQAGLKSANSNLSFCASISATPVATSCSAETIRSTSHLIAPSGDQAASLLDPLLSRITQPNATYLANTSKLTVGESSAADDSLFIDFGATGAVLTVPNQWATWSEPPHAESATPTVVYFYGRSSVSWTLSTSVVTLGVEVQPTLFETFDITAAFYSGPVLLGSFTSPVDGLHGARLFAATSLGPKITGVVISSTSPFAVAQIRYAFEEESTEPVELTLACDATVVRGDVASCIAHVDPPDASVLEVTDWTFTPTAGEPIHRTESKAAVEWTGQMVTSGRVTVFATLNGEDVTAAADITVMARDWSALKLVTSITNGSPGRLSDPPASYADLGNFQGFVVTDAQLATETVGIVADGPNAGYQYLKSLPVRLAMTVTANTNALREGSALWQRHPVRRVGSNRAAFCSRNELLSIVLPAVLEHEGLQGEANLDSHAAAFIQSAETAARARFEDLVGWEDLPTFGANRAAVQIAATTAAQQLDATNPIQLSCSVRFK